MILLLTFGLDDLSAQTEINFPGKSENKSAISEIDLNGLWEAEVSQMNWDGKPEFAGVSGRLHVEIEQIGTRVKGLLACRAKFADGRGYLSYDKIFEGIWNGKTLEYTDISVENYINTHKDLRHLETCIKTATLDFYKAGSKMFLEGDWKGIGHKTDVACIPGRIRLSKVMDEDLAMEEAQTVNVNFIQKEGVSSEVKIKNKKIKKLRDRKVEEGHNIEVTNRSFSITVYDHQRDDGDIISLNYNGKWILREYRIDHSRYKLDVYLDKDEKMPNYLVLYAHNLGEVSPNTVAVEIDDGSRVQRFILNSDMKTSDIIYFDHKPF